MSYLTKKTSYALAIIVAGTLLGGCIYEVGLPASGNKTFAPVNPVEGMHVQPVYRDQQAQPTFRDDQVDGMRYPPPGTIAVDSVARDEFATRADSTQWGNPVPINSDSLEYGRFLYNTNCAVCHGMEGHGDGTIVEAGHFGAPPTLNSAGLRGRSDGEIYHVVTYGQGTMWSFKNQLTEMERWAVVNYVRALQRADSPEPRDLDRMRNQ